MSSNSACIDFARLRVERAERLVHQQHRGIDGERARNADALFHAAGELMRAALLRIGEADQLEIFFRGVAQGTAAHALHFQAEHHVLQGIEPGQQFGVLEHHAAVVTAAMHFAPVHRDAAAIGRIEPHGDAQRGGLAAAGRPDQRHDLAVAHLETHAVQRLHVMQFAVHADRKALGDVEESNLTHSGPPA